MIVAITISRSARVALLASAPVLGRRASGGTLRLRHVARLGVRATGLALPVLVHSQRVRCGIWVSCVLALVLDAVRIGVTSRITAGALHALHALAIGSRRRYPIDVPLMNSIIISTVARMR